MIENESDESAKELSEWRTNERLAFPWLSFCGLISCGCLVGRWSQILERWVVDFSKGKIRARPTSAVCQKTSREIFIPAGYQLCRSFLRETYFDALISMLPLRIWYFFHRTLHCVPDPSVRAAVYSASRSFELRLKENESCSGDSESDEWTLPKRCHIQEKEFSEWSKCICSSAEYFVGR